MKIIKQTILFIIISIVVSTFGSVVLADNKQRIYDDAEILTQAEISQLEKLASLYSEKRETDFIVLTTKDASKSAEQYMADFYDEQKLGYDKPNGNTAIISVNLSRNEVYLSGFYKGKTYLSSKRLDKIRQDVTSDLTEGQYASAFKIFFERADYYFDFKPSVNPDSLFYKTYFQFILALVLALIIVGIMLFQSNSKITTTENTYRDIERSKVIRRKDKYLRRVVTKSYSPKPKSGSGGGGGGMTGGGHSYSGSGGRF